jgi:hypothetical protein
MTLSLETLAAVATIVGTIISLLALVQARTWLLLLSILVVALAIGAVFYARRQRLVRAAASNVIEGYSIDSLNVANLYRRLDRDFLIQEAEHVVRIEGADMKIAWQYSGYCRAAAASDFEFSIDSGPGIAFAELGCAGFDLSHDPEMTRVIRPLLIGPEGISKKISVPLLEPLTKNQPFGVLLTCTLPRCLTPGTAYYSSTLSFAQSRVRRCTVRLEFAGQQPEWMRVYDCTPGRKATLVKSLSASQHDGHRWEYVDVIENIPGQSARVYLFWREG